MKFTAYKSKHQLKYRFLHFNFHLPERRIYKDKNEFTFLNLTVSFGENIDWNYQKNGKLWNYNLQYFDFLRQSDVHLPKKVGWIKDIYHWLENGKLLMEPYPVSIRSINIIRFLSNNKIDDNEIIAGIYAELNFLSQRLEYHLMGNHLLENGFALLMGGSFFGKDNWVNKGKQLLRKELNEQILNDGAHFELSPMYHQIMLFRLLEAIEWGTEYLDALFINFLKRKAALMTSWIRNMIFSNGVIPLLNDSATNIAFDVSFLTDYAKYLGVELLSDLKLNDSGYRKIQRNDYECIIDFAEISVSYQPGHGHADALSFLLNYKGKPLFTEAGTSTYEFNERRLYERSTEAHNTVAINNDNQSEIWAAFRVGRRAHVQLLIENENFLEASHNGYMHKYGILHKRSFTFTDNRIIIIDNLSGIGNAETEACTILHLHPNVASFVQNGKIILNNIGEVNFDGMLRLEENKYLQATGFNLYSEAVAYKIYFENSLTTSINLQ